MKKFADTSMATTFIFCMMLLASSSTSSSLFITFEPKVYAADNCDPSSTHKFSI